MTDFLAELREELLDGLERYDRAPGWRRLGAAPARWRAGPAARRLAALAVAAATAVAVAVQVGDHAPDVEQGTAPPVSRLEGFHATALGAASGSLWVTQSDIDQVLRIDLRTGKITAHIDLGGSPGGIVVAGGAVWVHEWEHGRLLKIDPDTNRVVKRLAVGTSNSDIGFAAGEIWAIDERGVLLRIDPTTTAVTKRVPLGATAPLPNHGGSTLAAAGDTLWVVVADGHITEIDARAARIVGRARGPALPQETSRRSNADASGLWISSPARRDVLHFDAHTRRVTRFPVPGDPGALAIVDGRIWVGTLHESGTLTRVTVLDADGRIVRTMPVPQAAINIVPAPGGGAWVAFGEDTTVSPAALRLPSP